MKKTLKTASFLVVLTISIIGCKEIPPFIDFTVRGLGLRDTTYLTAPIPAAVFTSIYIEDLTGVHCNNCPKAADKIKLIRAANPGNTVSVGAYPSALTQLMAPWPGFDTLITAEADDIFSAIYNSPPFIPTGGVNRRKFKGENTLYMSYNLWAGYADSIKTNESPVIISGQLLSYDDITRKAKIRVKVVFAKKYDEALNLTVYLTESKILSKQTMPGLDPPKDDYEHNHALRKAITLFNGEPMKINPQIIGMYEPGRTFEKDFEVVLKTKWVKDNCSIVTLVNRFDNNSKEVIQASELELK